MPKRSKNEAEIDPAVADQVAIHRFIEATRELNIAWAAVPKPYSLWVDWAARPPRIVVTAGTKIERVVIYDGVSPT